jgi:organic hydroperoxide reductase OsmC/OhrA
VVVRAKSFSYAVSVDRDWTATSDRGGSPIPEEEAWTPEHLLLAGLARCTLTSLRYHAGRDGIDVTGGADASGEVTVRDTDSRYAFVRIEVDLDVLLEPTPPSVRELVAKAERDCFVGASLTATPTYRWTVNGEELA